MTRPSPAQRKHITIKRGIHMARTNKWSRVSILTALLNEVDNLIASNPQLGYPSTSSFVNEAVRRLLEKQEERINSNNARNAGNPNNRNRNRKTRKNP